MRSKCDFRTKEITVYAKTQFARETEKKHKEKENEDGKKLMEYSVNKKSEHILWKKVLVWEKKTCRVLNN